MSASWLQQFRVWYDRVSARLLLLPLENTGLDRHGKDVNCQFNGYLSPNLNSVLGFYSPEEKQQTVVVSPLLSSLLHLIRRLYRVKVDSRRTSSCFGNHKYFGSQHHVLLLLHDSIQARAEKVYMVEEIHYSSTDIAIRFHSASHPQHCSGQRLQFSKSRRLDYVHTEFFYARTFRRLLQKSVFQ